MPGRTAHSVGAVSSRKRGRRDGDQDNEDEEVVEVRNARSNLRTDSKRVRLSETVDIKSEDPAERDFTPSDDDANEEAAPPSPKTPSRSQYELMRDNNFEHLRHEVADDQRATQRLRCRSGLLGENAIADNGIIESVTCINFMCHVRLHCELGPLLNFIVGENGSGKSAILTAITLCLGGKASSTNRGGSLKSFVKEGCERAVLAVKIKNQGQDAYKHDIYGDSVIVERHFSKTGTSGFKVKTALGQVYSHKKQEVDELVEYYALQVDNPLNILSQDNARQFLNASSKAQKYKFFIEGVQLQQLDNDYRLISESLEQMVAKVPDQEERVKHAKATLEKAQRMMEELDGNRQVRDKARVLRLQLAWAQVVSEEEELRRRERSLAEIDVSIAQTEQDIENKNKALEVANDRVQRAEESLRDVKEEQHELQLGLDAADEVYRGLKAELQTLHVQEREAHQTLKACADRKKITEKRVQEEEARLAAINGEAQTAALQKFDEAKETLKRLDDEIQELMDREPQLVGKQKEAKEALEKIGDEFQQKRAEVDNAGVTIKRLEENRGSLFDAYEAQIPRLLEMIAADSRFESKPIGPLGTHIQLLKPNWSSILEKVFGANLNAFLVTSKRDEKLLYSMMKQLNVRDSPIFICSPRPLDIRGKEPDAEYDTILRALRIDNQMVRDQLIINHMIEQVILVPERVRAEQIMFDGAPPRNVKACLTFHDTRRNEGLRLVSSGNISTSPVKGNPHLRPRMKTDVDSQIALLKNSLQQIMAEYRLVDAERRRLQQEFQRCQHALERSREDRGRLEDLRTRAQKQVDDCEASLDKFENRHSCLLGLRRALAEAEDDVNHHGRQYGLLSAEKEDKNAEVEKAREKRKEEKVKVQDYEQRLSKAEARLKQAQDLRHVCLLEKNDIIAKATECAEAKTRAEGKLERQKLRVEERTAEAKGVSPERVYVPENETYESIEKQYNTLVARLKRVEERRGMSEQAVHSFFAEAKGVYDRVVKDLTLIIDSNTRLRDSLTLRLEKWRKFQRYISSQSRANFIYLLSERGFRGKLLLDHEAKSLDLQVEPDKTEKRAAGRSTKTLSGGEKSFSSICLLLAIWEAMGSPLRCLDEFDVFMDNVNRAISTNMLITAARRSVNRQYIFITPNAIEGRTTLDKDVKIIRLTDPRQRTLTDH